MISSKKIANTIVKLSQLPHSENRIQRFVQELRERKLSWIFPQVRNELERISRRDEEGMLVVETSNPLTETQKERIKKLFSTDSLREKVREDIVLGAEYYHKGKVYHGSVQWKLKQLKKRLSTLSQKVYED